MITVEKLSKSFASPGGTVHAVQDVDFTLEAGTFAVIVGKSGSGKSTLLALLGALERPTSGSITVGGKVISKGHDRMLTKYRRGSIGFIFQHYNLVPNLTALENVMIAMEFNGVGMAERKARATELLNQVGIMDGQQLRKPSRLSGGQQQRVAIARALANKPQLILADEPTGNLDSATGKKIVDLLKSLAEKEKTAILAVTHDPAIAHEADVRFRLSDGKLVVEKTTAKL